LVFPNFGVGRFVCFLIDPISSFFNLLKQLEHLNLHEQSRVLGLEAEVANAIAIGEKLDRMFFFVLKQKKRMSQKKFDSIVVDRGTIVFEMGQVRRSSRRSSYKSTILGGLQIGTVDCL